MSEAETQTGSPITKVHEHDWRLRGSMAGDPADIVEFSCDGCGSFAWYTFESMSENPAEEIPV